MTALAALAAFDGFDALGALAAFDALAALGLRDSSFEGRMTNMMKKTRWP